MPKIELYLNNRRRLDPVPCTVRMRRSGVRIEDPGEEMNEFSGEHPNLLRVGYSNYLIPIENNGIRSRFVIGNFNRSNPCHPIVMPSDRDLTSEI